MSYQTGICNFCGTGCGHMLQVEEGTIRGVFPSSSHPVGRGRLCSRGWHIHELLNTEERIPRPLVRKGGGLTPVSWDEALDEAAARLGAFSGEEIGFWASPRSSNEDAYALVRLARGVFRSANISVLSDVWYPTTAEVLREGTGRPGALGSIADIRKADFIFVVGTDLTRQNPIIASDVHFAARGGADVVTLSTRLTQMAKLSGTHLQNKPGTKNIVMAAMAKALLEDHPPDSASGAPAGFDGFRKSLEGLESAGLEARTGLPFDKIRDVARRLASARRAVIIFSTGITGLTRETTALIFNLFLAAGKAGREGCAILPVTGVSNLAGVNDMGAAPDVLPGWRRLPDEAAASSFARSWGKDVNAGRGRSVESLLADASSGLKALVVVDHDPEIELLAGRIKSLEFVLYLGAYANPFKETAHVVLPTTTYAETDGTYTNTERRIQLNRRKIEPRFEARPPWRIYADLAARRGQAWPYRSAADVQEEITRMIPEYHGAAHPALESRFGGWQWPGGSGPDQSRLRFVPLNGAFSAAAEPAPAEFPFRLMAGRSYFYWHLNNIMKNTFIPRREYNALLLLYPRGLVEVHPDDAAALGLRDKRPVRVVSARGSMTTLARVSDEVPPGTVYAPYFVGSMIPDFLVPHADAVEYGEDAVIPVRLEKV